MKTCTKCGETKELSEFGKHKRCKDGLRSSCKPCHRKANAAYRASNPDKEREYRREYREANPDKVRERDRGRKRKWRAVNRDKDCEYYEANRGKVRERIRKWQAANPEKVKSYAHARRAREVDLYGNEPDHARIAEWMQLTKDDACRWCGTRDFSEGVHWDHVVPLSIGGPHEWWNLVKTCAACNLRKHAKLPEAVGFA